MAQPVIGGLGSLVGYDLSLLPWVLDLYDIPKRHHRMMIDTLLEITQVAVKASIEKSKTSDSSEKGKNG